MAHSFRLDRLIYDFFSRKDNNTVQNKRFILNMLVFNHSVSSHAMVYSTPAVIIIKITIELKRITISFRKVVNLIAGIFVVL